MGFRKIAVFGAVATLTAIAASPAMAIQCKGRYQVVNGDEISTPFCEDNYLARVARSYGIKVSNRAIRQNPNTKHQICHAVGHDIRVSGICDDYGPGRYRIR